MLLALCQGLQRVSVIRWIALVLLRRSLRFKKKSKDSTGSRGGRSHILGSGFNRALYHHLARKVREVDSAFNLWRCAMQGNLEDHQVSHSLFIKSGLHTHRFQRGQAPLTNSEVTDSRESSPIALGCHL